VFTSSIVHSPGSMPIPLRIGEQAAIRAFVHAQAAHNTPR
jgi:hypothetical protein